MSTPTVPHPPTANDPAFLQNQVDWMSLQLQQIARVLELPATLTMKDLSAHASTVMAELHRLRGK